MFKVVRVLLLGGLVGKVLGVLRELMFAWLFGTGAVAAAYRLAQSAFLIPLHGLVSETLNGGFTPQYAVDQRTAPRQAAALFTGLYTVLLVISAVVAAGLFFGAGQWVALLAPGFDPERRQVAVTMVQVLAFALPAYVVSGLFAAVDLAMGRGALSASRASLQSLGLIVGTAAAAWAGMPSLIALGFVLAYLTLTIIGGRVMAREGLSLKPVWTLAPEAKTALTRLFKVVRVLVWIPIAFQINGVIERRVASLVSADAMAAVDYARFVTETLVILVAMPFGLAGLSTMANMSVEEFRSAKLRAFRALLYVGIPLSALLYANAFMVVELVFKRGAFGASSVAATTQILAGMAIGIWGQLIGYAGAKFLTARGQNANALLASLAGVGSSIAILLVAQPALGTQVLGIAAAAQGVIFGGFVLWRLKVIGALFAELMYLLGLSVVYVIGSLNIAHSLRDNWLLNAPFSAVFWITGLAVMPWPRRAFKQGVRQFWPQR